MPRRAYGRRVRTGLPIGEAVDGKRLNELIQAGGFHPTKETVKVVYYVTGRTRQAFKAMRESSTVGTVYVPGWPDLRIDHVRYEAGESARPSSCKVGYAPALNDSQRITRVNVRSAHQVEKLLDQLRGV